MSTVGVAKVLPWALAGAFGCWLSAATARVPQERRHSNNLQQPYRAALGPGYVHMDDVVEPVTDLSALAANVVAVRHLSPVAGDCVLPAGCALISDAVQAGQALVVQSTDGAQVWVPRLDRASHRPATLWHVQQLPVDFVSALAKPGASGQRSAFQQALLAAATNLQSLGVLTWSAQATVEFATVKASNDAAAGTDWDRTATAALGNRPRDEDTVLPVLPRGVQAATGAELLRVVRVRKGVDHAVTSLRMGQTSASTTRSRVALAHIEQLSDLQRAARAYVDSLWDQAFVAARVGS